MAITRRGFVAAGAAVLAQAQTNPASKKWYGRPMRWAQIAFVEDDPGNYDPAFWFDYLKRIHADAACLSAGGCVAFYPTEIPLHYRSKFLGNRDPFGEMVGGCRKLGMNVIARTDPHAAHEEMYRAHPDWIAVDAQGQKRRHWAMPEQWVTCALGPYNFDFMTRVTREIVEKYKVDGVFANRWAGQGQCYCEHCRENFRKATGLELPRTENPQDRARRAYIEWHQSRLFELWRLWDKTIQEINPNAAFLANSGGGALSNLDMKTVGELAPTIFADRQARRGVMPPWANGKNAKEYRATMGRKPIGGIFSVGLEEPYRWKDSVQSGDEIRIWVANGIANGLNPWFTKFNAKPFDRRWLRVVEEIYTWHHRNERYLRNEKPLARVALAYSQQTAAYYGGQQARARVEDPILGFYQALVESRIPFEMVHDRLLDEEHLRDFRTLLLPNIAALSDQQCHQIRSFVKRGGSIVATHETSLYDEWGNRRPDFGLSDLFGASAAGKVEGPMQNAYLEVRKTGNGYHPLLKGLEDTPRIIHGVRRVPTRPASADAAPLTLIPSYPDLPMEEVYPRVPSTDIPEVYLRESGESRVVYFPWDIDRTFWEVLATDHLKLLENAVTWATREDPPVSVKGPGVLDIALWRQKDSMTVHLVNLTNPMMMKGPVREILPVGAQQVRVRLEPRRKPKAARLLVAGREVPFRVNGNWLELVVPSIAVHEVVAFDLG